MSRKTDKLTVLRLAVQHMKTIRGSIDSYTEGNYKPPMLTDKAELQRRFFKDLGGCCKESIIGWKPVTIVHYTMAWKLYETSTTQGLDPVSRGPHELIS